jgi:iron complex outermembrane receptor protein
MMTAFGPIADRFGPSGCPAEWRNQRYAVAPSFSWRPDDKTDFTFLSNFQNDPDAGYYGWLPKEGTVVPLPNGKRLPTDFNEGERITIPIPVIRKWWATASIISSMTPLRCVRTCATRKIKFHRTAFMATACAQIRSIRATRPPAHVRILNGATTTRQYVIDNEKLQNFSVDTQLQSKFATGSVDHTLLTGVDFMRMRNDIDSGLAMPVRSRHPISITSIAVTLILTHTQGRQALIRC